MKRCEFIGGAAAIGAGLLVERAAGLTYSSRAADSRIEVRAQVLATADVHAHNTFANPNAVQPRSEQLAAAAGVVSFRFPPASVTCLQISLD